MFLKLNFPQDVNFFQNQVVFCYYTKLKAPTLLKIEANIMAAGED